MQASVQEIKVLRMPIVAVGLLAGFSISYLVNLFLDSSEDITGFYPVLIIFLPPVLVLGTIISVLSIWKPLSASDAESFVIWFWVPFFILYLVTYWLYWAVRV